MSVLDMFALDFLGECAELIDRRVAALEAEAAVSDDPDGILDNLEYVVGFGFVACQQYITEVTSNHMQAKKKALDLGPRHRTGPPIVAIVNAAANYWKHSPEWAVQDRGHGIRQLFEQVIGRPPGDYPVSGLFYELLAPLPSRFERIVPFLETWRDAVADTGRAV